MDSDRQSETVPDPRIKPPRARLTSECGSPKNPDDEYKSSRFQWLFCLLGFHDEEQVDRGVIMDVNTTNDFLRNSTIYDRACLCCGRIFFNKRKDEKTKQTREERATALYIRHDKTSHFVRGVEIKSPHDIRVMKEGTKKGGRNHQPTTSRPSSPPQGGTGVLEKKGCRHNQCTQNQKR